MLSCLCATQRSVAFAPKAVTTQYRAFSCVEHHVLQALMSTLKYRNAAVASDDAYATLGLTTEDELSRHFALGYNKNRRVWK